MRRLHPDFFIDVDGVGRCRVVRPTMEDYIAIEAKKVELLNGLESPPDNLEYWAGTLARVRVLVKAFPEGYDDSFPPYEDDSFAQLMAINAAIVAKESDFRRKPGVASEGRGPADGKDGSAVDSKEVQPPAN